VVHMPDGEVRFYKDENGLLYIDLKEFLEDAAALLVQIGSKEAAAAFIQTVQQNYEGSTKRKILQAKEAWRAMEMTGNPSKGDFKNMVRRNLINICPVTTNAITNACAIFGLVKSDYVSVPKGVKSTRQ
jgi:hypothetical protein